MRRGTKVKVLVMSVLVIIGGLFGFAVPGFMSELEARCSEEVTAVITDYEESLDDGSTMYAAVYEFDLNGETQRITSRTRTSWKPELGKEITLKVNPDKPSETFNAETDGIFGKIFRIVGLVLIGIGILVLFIPVKGRY